MDALTFTQLNQLVQLCQGVDVRASTDPAKLNLPAAWVTVEGIRQLAVGGQLQLECAIYLIAPDGDYARSYTQLATLYNKLVPAVLNPDGVVVPQGVVMPGNPTPMPALRIPVNLL